MVQKNEIFTIGHSNHSREGFLHLLDLHGINAIADVRSSPYSRFSHFNRQELSVTLKGEGIAYVFLGMELGARAEDPRCYIDNRAVYELIAGTSHFQDGLQRVVSGSTKFRLALMCAEQDPLDCHRAILVSRHLTRQGCTIYHILKNGDLEKQDDLEQRMVNFHKRVSKLQESVQLQLFSEPQSKNTKNHKSILEEAYEQQGKRIAYTK